MPAAKGRNVLERRTDAFPSIASLPTGFRPESMDARLVDGREHHRGPGRERIRRGQRSVGDAGVADAPAMVTCRRGIPDLTVVEVPQTGQARVRAEGRLLGKHSAEQLARGQNVASATANGGEPGGPWDAQSDVVKELIDARDKAW